MATTLTVWLEPGTDVITLVDTLQESALAHLALEDASVAEANSETLLRLRLPSGGEEVAEAVLSVSGAPALVFESDVEEPGVMINKDATGDFAVHAVKQAIADIGLHA